MWRWSSKRKRTTFLLECRAEGYAPRSLVTRPLTNQTKRSFAHHTLVLVFLIGRVAARSSV